jgi:capsular polysaccharide transport system permease protein
MADEPSGAVARRTGVSAETRSQAMIRAEPENLSGASEALENVRFAWTRSFWFVSFVLLVALPFAFAVFYIARLAAPQFETEIRFAVVGDTVPLIGSDLLVLPGGNNGLSKLISVNYTQDDAIVSDFIHSPAMVSRADEAIDLRKIFRRPPDDFVARIKDKATFEELVGYWKTMVHATTDSVSGAVFVTVRSFDAKDTRAIAEQIASESEKLVDRLMIRDRENMLSLSQQEADRAVQDDLDSLNEEHTFRDANAVINPEDQAKSILNTIVALRTDRLTLDTELKTNGAIVAQNSPTAQLLRDQIRALDKQVADLESKITLGSGGGAALSSAEAEWQRIELRRQFADAQFQAADSARDAALHESESHHLYVEMYQPPSEPDQPLRSRPILWLSGFLGVALCFWVTLNLAFDVVRLHVD